MMTNPEQKAAAPALCAERLHGPNLNMLGMREPHLYGADTWPTSTAAWLPRLAAGMGFDWLQSNAEHVLIDRIHAAYTDGAAFIIINPAAFTTPAWRCAMPWRR